MIKATTTIAACLMLSIPAAAQETTTIDDLPSLDTCIKYAEADHAFNAAQSHAQGIYSAAKKQADSTYHDTRKRARDTFQAALATAEADYNSHVYEPETIYHAALKKRVMTAFGGTQQMKSDAKAAPEAAEATYETVKRQRGAILTSATQAARDTYETANNEAEAARQAAMSEPRTTVRAAETEARAAQQNSYSAIYEGADTKRSDIPAVMEQLRRRHRDLCRVHHQL